MARLRPLRLLAFWAAVILAYIMALLPGAPGVVSSDKLQHMLAFGVMTLLGRLAYPALPAWLLFAGLTGFGALIELSQAAPFIGRDASWGDLSADAIATLLALLVAGLLLPRRE